MKGYHATRARVGARAARNGEVPVGAVVVRDGEVLGEGANQPIEQPRSDRSRRDRRVARGGRTRRQLSTPRSDALRDHRTLHDVRRRVGPRARSGRSCSVHANRAPGRSSAARERHRQRRRSIIASKSSRVCSPTTAARCSRRSFATRREAGRRRLTYNRASSFTGLPMTDTLLVLPGPPAFSAFRLNKLLVQVRAADPAVTALYAEYVHLLSLNGDTDDAGKGRGRGAARIRSARRVAETGR